MTRKVLALDFALFGIGLLWLGLGCFREIRIYDEGIALVGGFRILEGAIPYRDFYAIYTPGHYYLTALAFALGGPSVLAVRLVSLLVRASIAFAAYRALRRIVSTPAAIVVWAVFLLVLSQPTYFGIPAFPALLLALLSVLALHPSRTADITAGRAALSGALGALALLFRQDFGVYALAAAATLVVVRHRRGAGRGLAGLAAGATLLLLGPALYFASTVGPAQLFHDLFVWPYRLTSEYRGLPYPTIWHELRSPSGVVAAALQRASLHLPFYLVPSVYLATGARLLLERRSRPPYLELHLLLLGTLLFNQALRRSDPIHLLPTLLIALILIAPLGGPRRAARAVVGLLLALLLFAPLRSAILVTLPSLAVAPHGIARARGVVMAADQVAALDYVRATTSAGEPIYVGNSRHDVAVWNDIAFYFLAERRVPTAFYKFDPGITTDEEFQRTMIREIDAAGVRTVVLYAGSEGWNEPNASSLPGATALDRYLRSRFEATRRFGRYTVLSRKENGAAGNPAAPSRDET